MGRAAPRPGGMTNDFTWCIRVSRTQHAAMHGFARRHNRTLVDEARAAIDFYIAEAMLDVLANDPSFLREVCAERPDVDPEEFSESVFNDAQLARARAFRHLTPVQDLAVSLLGPGVPEKA